MSYKIRNFQIIFLLFRIVFRADISRSESFEPTSLISTTAESSLSRVYKTQNSAKFRRYIKFLMIASPRCLDTFNAMHIPVASSKVQSAHINPHRGQT